MKEQNKDVKTSSFNSKDNTFEQKKFVDKIKDKIHKEIYIQRVPRHAKKWFIDYSNDYFEGDYGMCLKHIIDSFRGMTPIGYEELQVQITELQNKLQIMEGLVSQPEKVDENVKKMADGTKRTTR